MLMLLMPGGEGSESLDFGPAQTQVSLLAEGMNNAGIRTSESQFLIWYVETKIAPVVQMIKTLIILI